MAKLQAFRYPLVTYLTANMFRLLSKGLRLLHDRFERKDVDGYDVCLASQFFSLVSANFRALNMAGLKVGDLLRDKAELTEFVRNYDDCFSKFTSVDAVKASFPADL
jgi:hypothetical protein